MLTTALILLLALGLLGALFSFGWFMLRLTIGLALGFGAAMFLARTVGIDAWGWVVAGRWGF